MFDFFLSFPRRRESSLKKDKIRSFTLVELLIVIAILAILAAAVVIVLNPAELLAQARDSQRISDVNMVKKAVDLFVIDNSTTSLGTANRVYISIPDSSSSCANISGLPTLPATWQYVCATSANLRNINGTGWLPLNLSLVKGGSPIPYLPIDPQNDQSLTRYYQYIPGTNTFELTALMESEKQAKAAGKDGGTDAGRLEVGSDVSLWRTASGLVGYWPFDENSGVTATSNIGSNIGYITGASWVTGKKGSSLNFDGVNNKIELTNTVPLTGAMSISFWGYSNGYAGGSGIGGDQTVILSGRICFRSATTVGFWTAGGTTDPINTSAFPIGQWFHMVVTRDASNGLKVYRNGEDVTLGNYTQAGQISINRIGDNPNDSGLLAWNGMMDEYYIYDRQLKIGEVKAIYNSAK